MPHSVEHIPLYAPGPGTERFLTVHRFGQTGVRPRVYLQAALHADELPGSLVLNHLLAPLRSADEKGEIQGEIVVVPCANPVGLSNRLMGYHIGRFGLDGDGNFNRWYPDFGKKVAECLGDQLGHDKCSNSELIQQAVRASIAAWSAPGEVNNLRRQLLLLSVDADYIFDLHCHGQSIQYIYLPENTWSSHSDLAAELGCQVALLFPTDTGTSFDAASTRIWHHVARSFPELPIADPPFTTTIELRSQTAVYDDIAARDARGIWRYLQRRNILAGNPGPPPDLACEPTPLAGSDNLVAPCAGVLAYRREPGDRIRNGEVIADIVDPNEVDFDRARTPVASRATGVFYGRAISRLVRPGQSFAVVSGKEPLSPGAYPVFDW